MRPTQSAGKARLRSAPFAVLARGVSAGALCSLLFGLIDTGLRHDFGRSAALHVAFALSLQLGWGAVLGLVLAAGCLCVGRARPASIQAMWFEPVAAAVLAVALTWRTAYWAFSGERIGTTVWANVGPALFLLACAAAAAATVRAWRWAARRSAATFKAPLALSAGCVTLACVLVFADSSLLVSLYARLHTFVEVVAWLLLWSVVAFWLEWFTERRLGLRGPVLVLGLTALASGVGIWASDVASRSWSEGLSHCLAEERYVGRTLRRLQDARAWVRDPTGALGITSNRLRLEALLARYDIPNATLGPKWKGISSACSRTGEGPLPNIAIFYVDTLRHDVATDPETMPNASRFLRESLWFRHAYASGSDTATSLPGITGGRYDTPADASDDLISFVARAGYDMRLVIPRSAREYLRTKRPQFHFGDTSEVADYDEGRKVWGYGADKPTAAEIVNRGLLQLSGPRTRPLLLWLFHYDLHNWRDVSDSYADELTLVSRGQRSQRRARYLAVARVIDRQFGRFLAALEREVLGENTIVVFLSDHGEALGRQGSWAHSVKLWEELVRVPLGLRVPTVAARTVDTPVSLVDLAPTLAGTVGHVGSYHGEDLLALARAARPQRQLPILFRSTLGGHPVCGGLLDEQGSYKLVLHFDAAGPELYDLDAADPDAHNVANSSPLKVAHLLEELVHSPVFPR
ncbi:MAG: sulfatase-like hydrolase/transferase [Polyangiaceae bacterium]|nr:sulfatase-like hydrolase/transferase [Polyangiaceae bacterium]